MSLAVLLGACGGQDWSARLRQDPLHVRAQQARAAASCAKLVPLEFARTLPVPVVDGGLGYRVLYYPLSGGFGQAQAHAPRFSGTFAPDSASSDRCESLGAAQPAPRGPAVRPGLSMKEYDRAQVRYFEALAKIGPVYASGGSDKQAAADFLEAFMAAAEPGMLADYYNASPAFWEWLRAQAGASIPKPS